MDVLTVEPLDVDALVWLGARHAVKSAPELAADPAAYCEALGAVRAAIVPPSVAIDAEALKRAPRLRLVCRLSAGAENIDLAACAQAGVEVVRPASAGAQAEAEFAIAALLQMLRRVPVFSSEGLLLGRELAGSVVGVIGMTPTVRHLAPLLAAFRAKGLGHDPGMPAEDPGWERLGLVPVALRDLLRASDAVCVLLSDIPRNIRMFNEALLGDCKTDQVLVSLAHSSLFNEAALARTLREGPLAAAWLDNVEAGLIDAGRPLCHIDTLQITPRVGAVTRQSRQRSAWALVKRIDEVLAAPARPDHGLRLPGVPTGPAGGPAPV